MPLNGEGKKTEPEFNDNKECFLCFYIFHNSVDVLWFFARVGGERERQDDNIDE